jgi:hypothetical protein
MIQLSHDDEHKACVRALHALEQYGSHFVTHADWGCKDGTHTGWMVADVDSREEAMAIVPPEFRHQAVVVKLNHFTREEIASYVAELERSENEDPGSAAKS